MSYKSQLQLASKIKTELVPSWSCSKAVSKPVWHTCISLLCTVKNSWWWTEELSETCRFYLKNKFQKLMHLVGFIIRIYHDARSLESQMFLTIFFQVFSLKDLTKVSLGFPAFPQPVQCNTTIIPQPRFTKILLVYTEWCKKNAFFQIIVTFLFSI